MIAAVLTGTSIEQKIQYRHGSSQRCPVQRIVSLPIGYIHARTGINQQLNHLGMSTCKTSTVHSPMLLPQRFLPCTKFNKSMQSHSNRRKLAARTYSILKRRQSSLIGRVNIDHVIDDVTCARCIRRQRTDVQRRLPMLVLRITISAVVHEYFDNGLENQRRRSEPKTSLEQCNGAYGTIGFASVEQRRQQLIVFRVDKRSTGT